MFDGCEQEQAGIALTLTANAMTERTPDLGRPSPTAMSKPVLDGASQRHVDSRGFIVFLEVPGLDNRVVCRRRRRGRPATRHCWQGAWMKRQSASSCLIPHDREG